MRDRNPYLEDYARRNLALLEVEFEVTSPDYREEISGEDDEDDM